MLGIDKTGSGTIGKIAGDIVEIIDIPDPRVAIYTAMNENQLKRIYEPAEGLFICESRKVIERAIAAGYEVESLFVAEEMVEELGEILYGVHTWTETGTQCGIEASVQTKTPVNGIMSDVPVYVASDVTMKKITGYSLTGGMLAAMRRKPPNRVEEVICSAQNIVVLDDIENPTNVGAIFRSAAALGADAILLTKGCADPLYRRAVRVSMGTVFSVNWTYVPDVQEKKGSDGESKVNCSTGKSSMNCSNEEKTGKSAIELLNNFGFTTIAFALSDNAKELNDPIVNFRDHKALIFGNEDHGISDRILSECDHIVKIPMSAGVDSLNVAAASAVACWELFKKEK